MEISTLSTRCKVLISVGILPFIGLFAVVLWQTLVAQSTARETDNSKNQTKTSADKIPFDVTLPGRASEISTSNYLTSLKLNVSDPSHHTVGQEIGTSSSHPQLSEDISGFDDQPPTSSEFRTQISTTSSTGSEWIARHDRIRILNHFNEHDLSTVPLTMLLLDRIISNSTTFPYFNAPFPGFAYPASDSFIQIRNECVSALDFTTMGMVKIALVQFDLMSQVDEIVDLFGKPEVAVSLIKRPLENMKKKSILCVERTEEIAARFQSVLQLVVKVFEVFKQDILPYGDHIDRNDTEYHGTSKCNKAVENITGNLSMFVEMLRTKNETFRLEVVDQLNRMLEVCDQIVTSQTHEFDRSQNHSSLATRLAIINAKKFELVKNVLEINQNVGNVSMSEIQSTFQDEFQNLHHDGLTLVKEIDRLKPILQSLYKFKNNWSKETRFFTGLADSVKFDVHQKAVDFISLMNTTRYLATSQEVDLIYKKTLSLNEVASKLEWVTSLYVNISDIYLSPCINSEDSIDIEKACTRASKDIVHFVNERKIELWEKMVLHRSKLEEKFLHVQADDEHFSEVTEFEP